MNWRRYVPYVSETPPSELCHHEQNNIWPSEDASIWYLKEKDKSERTYWSEKDAVFIKLREVTKTFICEGCGEIEVRQTAEKVGGPNAIKRKDAMTLSELEKFNEMTNSGAFYNGFGFYSREYLFRGKNFYIPKPDPDPETNENTITDDAPSDNRILAETFCIYFGTIGGLSYIFPQQVLDASIGTLTAALVAVIVIIGWLFFRLR